MIMPRLNGKVVLIKGNHDKAALSVYSYHFEDVRAAHELTVGDDTFILTHVPVHPDSLGHWKEKKVRWKGNIHGHLHTERIDDPRYLCVSVEQTEYEPIHLDQVLYYFGGKDENSSEI
jgi:calcineurin-like phosphoesterase family protein